MNEKLKSITTNEKALEQFQWFLRNQDRCGLSTEKIIEIVFDAYCK